MACGDARRIDTRCDRLSQLGDRDRGKRADRQFVQRVVSAEPFDEAAAGSVVVELGRPRSGDERDVGDGGVEMTHRELEECHRTLVEPVDVVQEDGDR